jgi:hypothetical protein
MWRLRNIEYDDIFLALGIIQSRQCTTKQLHSHSQQIIQHIIHKVPHHETCPPGYRSLNHIQKIKSLSHS